MDTPRMVGKQIYIDDDLEQGMKALPPATVHVDALQTNLEGQHGPLPKRDPLLAMVGLVDEPSGPRDVAEEHDHYLYGTVKREQPARG